MRNRSRREALRQYARGSVSIFLILVIMPIFSGTYLAIDAGRTAAARARVEAALDLTGNAALNDYDQALKDWYGLFAMGKSKGTFETELGTVFSGMIDAGEATGGTRAGITYDNYINTRTKSFTVKYPATSALARPDVMERTLTDYMKYRAPYQFARGVSQRIGAFRNIRSASEVLSKSQDYYDSLSGVSRQLTKIADGLPVTGDQFDPTAEQKAIDTIESGLGKLTSTVQKTDNAAASWKSALDSMPAGEAKSLLAGDYKATAEVLNRSEADALREQLTKDRAALESYLQAQKQVEADRKAAEDAEQDPSSISDPAPPELSYKTNALYGYIASSRTASGSGDADTRRAQKSALEALARTDRTTLVSGVPDKYVSQVLGSDVSKSIDAAGGSAANVPAGTGSTEVKATMSSLKGFFAGLAGSTDSLMSDSYVEEFLTETFSCYTSGEKDTTIAGKAFSEGPLFRGETEYILFGQEYLPANVHLATELIFMVRLLFNSIYVFSNANMRAEALAAATALAAWTGAGVAVMQNLLLTAWAMAESVSDVSTLVKGGTVPLYKSAATWTIGLSGVTGKLQEGAVNLVSHTVDDVYAKIEKAADDKLEDVRDAALSYLQETSEGAVESLTNMILTPVEARLTTFIGDKTDAQDAVSKKEIRALLTDAVDSADNGSAGYRAAKTAFETTALGPLTDTVWNNYKNLTSLDEELSKAASQAITNGLHDAYSTLFSEVKKAVDRKVSSAEQKLHQAFREGGEELKADLIDALDGYGETLSGYLGSGSGSGSSTAPASLSSGSGTAMSYKDHLKVFVFAGIVNNKVKAGMLTRCAKVMQANCHTSEKKFHIAKTYRSVTLSGSATIVTHTVKGKETYAY